MKILNPTPTGNHTAYWHMKATGMILMKVHGRYVCAVGAESQDGSNKQKFVFYGISAQRLPKWLKVGQYFNCLGKASKTGVGVDVERIEFLKTMQ